MQRNQAEQAVWNGYYKNATVGAHAIGTVIERAKHPKFRSLLEKQQAAYQQQQREVKAVLAQSGIEPTAHTAMAKACCDMGIWKDTMLDQSDSNLAKIMLEGTNMGVITLLQTLHAEKGLSKQAMDYGEQILKRENAYMESLKTFL